MNHTIHGFRMDKVLVGSSKVTSRGQITIPQELREKYKIDQGDMIYFIENEGMLIIQKGPIKL